MWNLSSFRLTKFLPKFEELLFFLKSLSYETFIFGDFNINTLITDNDKVNYENLLNSFDCKIQNTLPTRVTPTTKSCLDHWIASDELYTQTIETTISDHFTVAASIPLTSRKSYKKELEKKKVRKMKNLKGDNALNFLFLLDQKLKKIQSTSCTEMRAQMMCEKTIEYLDKFAPEKGVVIKNETNSWITNEIKNAMVKRDCLFRKWFENPNSKNHIEYKNQQNVVTQKIRLAKKETNFKKLGPNPSPKHIYRTLK